MAKEERIPLSHDQHNTLDIVGRIWRNGRYRNLVIAGDIINFDIYKDDGNDQESVRLNANSNSGITQTEQGEFRIIMEDHLFAIPADIYQYSLKLTEGDSLRSKIIAKGPFTLNNSPQPLT